jgi:phytoene synthase
LPGPFFFNNIAGMSKNRPESGSNFYPAFLLLSRERREALSAVYAYCRAVDDVADEPGGTEAGLEAWRSEIDDIYRGKPTTRIGVRIRAALQKFPLPREGFEEILEGARMDLAIRRYRTIEGLELYMYRVASAVGLLCIEVFGRRTASAAEYARYLGYAFQLTNILRDVDEDLARGRIYLPMEDLARCGYSEKALQERTYNTAFIAAMQHQYRRARGYYDKARAVLDPADRKAMLPAEVMAGVYEGILEKLRRTGFRVFEGKVSLSSGEKAAAAARAWWRVRLGGWSLGPSGV